VGESSPDNWEHPLGTSEVHVAIAAISPPETCGCALPGVGGPWDAGAACGAGRQVFFANGLKSRPPGNRNPRPAEVAQCEPYLMRQIALVQPRLILAMGRFAAQSLLKSSEPIGRLRTRVHEVQGVPVVVTYHPAYLLRNPVDKALVWDDLCRARELLAAQPSR